jgi:diadenosine tetraphosphate (Ap4A) HIT family hydrolase
VDSTLRIASGLIVHVEHLVVSMSLALSMNIFGTITACVFISSIMNCFFCENSGGVIIQNNELFRIVLVADRDYPGYLRVVLNGHVVELTDLSDTDNIKLYQAVVLCEKSIRKVIQPDKINIASFGNVTPHIHWHIVPRFHNDKHFPNPIWGEVTHSNYIPKQQLLRNSNDLIKEIQANYA